jgi:hypothetical protein
MSTMMGAIRKRIFTPAPSEISFDVRNFHKHDPQAQQRLEMSALQFIMGFEFAIEYKDVEAMVTRLETLDEEYRGFAYEGATMATSLRDALSPIPGAGRLTTEFLSGPAAHHIYMAYLGVGFALARLPKMLWRRALPDQSQLPDHPTLNWLAIDGYGFHQTFFDTRRWVEEQYVQQGMVWEGHRDYVLRVLDHGVGRAMWFVAGGDVDRLTTMINKFTPRRHADLWSGAGLAATYAGGVDEESLKLLLKNAGDYRPEVAQGAVFALKARVLARVVTAHNEMASQVFCGSSAAEASALADQAVIDLHDAPDVPAYEIFRRRIQENFR